MRKVRTFCIVLLAIVLISLLAIMPQVISKVSDFLGNEKPGTAPMQSVELALGTDKSEQPGYMLRKLVLEHRMNTLPIRPEQVKMTEDEVLSAAVDGMTRYVDANMFAWFEYDHFSAEPYLGVDTENTNNNMIFWGVTFSTKTSTKNDPYHYLFLHIDDETGKIIYIAYETYGEDYFRYDPENQWFLMEGFVDSFLGPLNLTASQLSEYDNLQGSAVEQNSTDEETSVLYTFEDAEFGRIHVSFVITPVGFHIYFPSE